MAAGAGRARRTPPRGGAPQAPRPYGWREGALAPRVESTLSTAVADDLAISAVAEHTGLAAGTIRMWEQRYGFPAPRRAPSGYRRYAPEDVETLRRVQAYRRRGLSVRAAIDRARETGGGAAPPGPVSAAPRHDAP